MKKREKKQLFQAYGINLTYEFETYKCVGLDYGDSKTADMGWELNFRRWKRKRKNRKENLYKFCSTYFEWKQHVDKILPKQEQDKKNLIHYLIKLQNIENRKVECVKCVLIPVYLALFPFLDSIEDMQQLGDAGKTIVYSVCLLMVICISVSALHGTMWKVEFYRDFIEIAKEKKEE